jgi:hypothetical protein
MIHVATVHFKSAKWIDVQLAYLRRNLHEPFRVVANLQGVPGQHEEKFDLVVPGQGGHPGKLNLLGSLIIEEAKQDDLIMFLDGDAFPVVDPMPKIRKALDESVLVAVRRDENYGDPQPHPCFCVVRAEDWDRLRGDWSTGFCWRNSMGDWMTDTGGNMLGILERSGEPWTPLLRSNRVNLHPLLFALYGDVVYHHGSGFREPLGPSDVKGRRLKRGGGVMDSHPNVGLLQRNLRQHVDGWVNRMHDHRRRAVNTRLSDGVFADLSSNPLFYQRFL